MASPKIPYWLSQHDPTPPAILTFAEAMAYLKVSRSTMYRLMQSGQLPGHKVGSCWRFYQADLQRVIVRAEETPHV